MLLFAPLISFLFFLGIQGNNEDKDNTTKCVKVCPEKWEKKEDQCFLWPSIRENWVRAEKYCKNEGGHLASVTNIRIHNYIRSRIDPNHHETRFLVGGQRSKGKWKWTDGSHWEFEKWAPGQPDNVWPGENCLQVWKKGWNDLRCSTKDQICLQPASQQDMFRQSYNRQSKHQHQ